MSPKMRTRRAGCVPAGRRKFTFGRFVLHAVVPFAASFIVSGWPQMNTPARAADPEFADRRAYLHGVNLLSVDDRYLLVFSSNGYPPRRGGESWGHDVFYAWINPGNPRIDPQFLISHPEAQEPASASMNSRKQIMVTCEDGSDRINQFAGLWSSELAPVRRYSTIVVRRGGHSGHVAAMRNKFVVTYGEGWIDEGNIGVEGLGTGDDVWVRLIDSAGALGPEIEIAVGPDTRDWWPVVDASDSEALVVWQRHDPEAGNSGAATLQGAIVDAGGSVTARLKIAENIDYYHYDVRYLSTLRRYLITGSDSKGGFAVLVDSVGNVVSRRQRLPHTVREARTAVFGNATKAVAVYPISPTGAAVLAVDRDSIELSRTLTTDNQWDSVGTDGVFVTPTSVLFATGSIVGVELVTVDLGAESRRMPRSGSKRP